MTDTHALGSIEPVKPLIWQAFKQKWHWYAYSVVGIYTVAENSKEEIYLDLDGKVIGGRFTSLSSAQDAAQADYSARILSAISPEYLERVRAMEADDPENDATDGAHPAWWRGNDRGIEATVTIVNNILDGKSHGAFGSTSLNELAERLVKANIPRLKTIESAAKSYIAAFEDDTPAHAPFDDWFKARMSIKNTYEALTRAALSSREDGDV